jgi:hypothetical protein
MLNVIYNKLRSIKHIQNFFFGGVDVIMTSDLYQHHWRKIVGSFKISKIMLMY